MSYLDKLPQPQHGQKISPPDPVASPPPEEPITIEPADEAVRARPVYWERDGQILGPATVTDFAKSGEAYWLWIEFEGQGRWIRDHLLRSRTAWEAQRASTAGKQPT